MHHERVVGDRDGALVEREAPRLDESDVPEPHHVLDGAQHVQLPDCEGGRLRHGRGHRPVDAHHDPGVLEPDEEIVQRRGCDRSLHRVGGHAQEHRGIGLDHGTVEHPGIARPHPADRVGVDAVRQQPDTGVGRRLARADDHVLPPRLGHAYEVVDFDDRRTVRDLERRRGVGGYVGGQVAGVNDPARRRQGELLASDTRDDLAIPDVLGRREELDSVRREHLIEDLEVVGADLVAGGPLVQAGLGSAGLHAAAAEQGRRDAVERRCLVQPHERVGVEPVAADAVAAVDYCYSYVGVVDQRVGERHAHGAAPHDEVVGVQAAGHASTQARRHAGVQDVSPGRGALRRRAGTSLTS